MKVEDLMVGDWVYITEHPMRKEAKQVKPEHFLRSLVTFEPIPLTPEILEKNGIIYEKPSFYYVIKDDNDLECTYYIQQVLQGNWVVGVDIGAYDCSVFARIEYVHELQHALKLCKIDKESGMILFKIIKCIFSIISMILTVVYFIGDDIKKMCFFGIISIWYLIDLVHEDIKDKLK